MKRPSGFDDRGWADKLPHTPDPGKVQKPSLEESKDRSWFYPRKRKPRDDEGLAQLNAQARERERSQSVWDRDRDAETESYDTEVLDTDSYDAAQTSETARDSGNETEEVEYLAAAEERAVTRHQDQLRGRVRTVFTAGVIGKWFGSETAERAENAASGRSSVEAVAESDRRVRAAKKQLKHVQRQAKKENRRQSRRFSGFRRKQRRKWYIGGGVIALLAAIVAIGVFTPVMDVRDIEIVGAERVEEAQIADSLHPLEGTPIALVNDHDVYRALESFDLIQSFSVETIPPHKLVVRIQERVPVLAIEEGEKFRQYDVAGVVIAESEEAPERLPVAEGDVRNPGSEAFQAAAGVLRGVPAKLRAEISTVDASTLNDVTFQLNDGIEVRWGGTEDSQVKAVILDRMRKALAETSVSMIDVSSSNAPVYE